MFFIPAIVNIGGIKINSPDHGSAVSFGANFSVGMRVSGKKNQGFGSKWPILREWLSPLILP
ncbi:hypothetical protein NDK43_09935 [Neobacillus pocheonensis]|uniref:Spore germination protein n=1 Tax=Neobacillus pocheonensis TaxID=363869 RepID=A0ABT0W8J0_9BACI|nr:hypothetical protein [Neobacillus pocheonensis]